MQYLSDLVFLVRWSQCLQLFLCCCFWVGCVCFCGTGLLCIPQSLTYKQSWFSSSAGQRIQGVPSLNRPRRCPFPRLPSMRPDQICMSPATWGVFCLYSSGPDHLSSQPWPLWRSQTREFFGKKTCLRCRWVCWTEVPNLGEPLPVYLSFLVMRSTGQMT